MRKQIGAVGLAVVALTAGVYATHSSPARPAPPSQCHATDLPDRVCTPGVVDPAITKVDICPHLGSTVVRRVPQSVKDDVRRRYNDYNPGEIDHLISLELGGSNDEANLWPQDGPIPNAKDTVENRLHRQVCAGQITLAQAQQKIRTDWRKA